MIKTKTPQDAQFHLRIQGDLYKKVIKANSADSFKTGVKKSINTTMIELIEKGLAKS